MEQHSTLSGSLGQVHLPAVPGSESPPYPTHASLSIQIPCSAPPFWHRPPAAWEEAPKRRSKGKKEVRFVTFFIVRADEGKLFSVKKSRGEIVFDFSAVWSQYRHHGASFIGFTSTQPSSKYKSRMKLSWCYNPNQLLWCTNVSILRTTQLCAVWPKWGHNLWKSSNLKKICYLK